MGDSCSRALRTTKRPNNVQTSSQVQASKQQGADSNHKTLPKKRKKDSKKRGPSSMLTEEEKKTKRVLANRKSARSSRERRQRIFEDMQAHVRSLSTKNRALKQANSQLHQDLENLLSTAEALGLVTRSRHQQRATTTMPPIRLGPTRSHLVGLLPSLPSSSGRPPLIHNLDEADLALVSSSRPPDAGFHRPSASLSDAHRCPPLAPTTDTARHHLLPRRIVDETNRMATDTTATATSAGLPKEYLISLLTKHSHAPSALPFPGTSLSALTLRDQVLNIRKVNGGPDPSLSKPYLVDGKISCASSESLSLHAANHNKGTPESSNNKPKTAISCILNRQEV